MKMGTHFLCVDMCAIHKEADAAVLHDPCTMENQHQMSPLAFLCQFGAPEPDVRVIQDRFNLMLTCELYGLLLAENNKIMSIENRFNVASIDNE